MMRMHKYLLCEQIHVLIFSQTATISILVSVCVLAQRGRRQAFCLSNWCNDEMFQITLIISIP
jgi:hypothetical protein